MDRPSLRIRRIVVASLVALLLQGCGSTTLTPTIAPAPSRAPATEPSPTAPSSPLAGAGTPAPSIPGPSGFLKVCADDPMAYCGKLTVPLDRTKPDGQKISLALRLLPHTDTSQPALSTVLNLPGGPGSGAGAGPGHRHDDGLLSEALILRHDTLLMDPRGTGASGAIDCPDLQDGWASDAEMQTAVAACAAQLGANADHYGSGDVALDIEDVRASMGLDQIDIYGMSYGTVWARAYAERFPDRVHAMVLDSGLTIDDPADHWGSGYAQAWLQIAARSCAESATCAKNHPHPEAELTAFVRRVRAKPVHGPSNGSDVVIDSAALVGILAAVGPFDGNVAAEVLLDAASANAHGDDGPVLKLSDWAGTGSDGGGDPAGFSEGMHAAATCIDDPIARNSQEALADRSSALATRIAALPKDAFAPFTVAEWMPWAVPDSCLAWPVPGRVEPGATPGTTIQVPTLVLTGEQDGTVPAHVQRRLLDVFPNSTLAVVAGAVHGVLGWSRCPRDLMAGFLETLRADGATCAPAT